MNQLSELSSVEVQGLVDLCRLLRGWEVAESVGLVADGRPVPEAIRLVENEGTLRNIVPRDPVVYPLDLLTSLLTNPDGGIPTRHNSGNMKSRWIVFSSTKAGNRNTRSTSPGRSSRRIGITETRPRFTN